MERFNWDLYNATKENPSGPTRIFDDRIPEENLIEPSPAGKVAIFIGALIFMIISVGYSFYTV